MPMRQQRFAGARVCVMVVAWCWGPGAALALAQAPAVKKAREAAAGSENAEEGRAAAANAAGDDDFGGDDTAPKASAKKHKGAKGKARTQEETTQDADDAAAGEEPGDSAAAEGGQTAPEQYTVQPGDTLWDLCERYLQNPFYWPKIWSINPQIENAHWIYPGNVIRFYAGGEGGGAQAQDGEAGEEGAEGGDRVAQGEEGGGEDGEEGGGARQRRRRGGGGEDGADEDSLESPDAQGSEGGLLASDEFSAPDAVGSKVRQEQLFDAGNVTKVMQNLLRPKGYSQRLTQFVSKKELEKAGEITAALTEASMLSTQSGVALSLKGAPQEGDIYMVFHAAREIKHPVTGLPLAYMVEVLGLVRITHAQGGSVLGLVTECYAPISRGDKISLVRDWNPPVEERPNARAVKGVVAATLEEGTTLMGEYHVVFLDRGKSDGVELGNTFTVVRDFDPYVHESRTGPLEVVGKLLVVDAKDSVSTGVVTMSTVEIGPGDKVEMRVPDHVN